VKAVAFVGPSGCGKTTLIEALLPHLQERGLAVGYLKSDAHAFDMDRPGKDTDRVFRGGAARVAIASPEEAALRLRLVRRDPLRLVDELFRGCDLVLVEGFKSSPLPKVEVRRVAGAPALLPAGDPTLRAVVSPFPDPRPLPRFHPDDAAAIARFLLEGSWETVGGDPPTR